MTRVIHRPIAVTSWHEQEPVSFMDGLCVHVVEHILDRWLEMGDWWSGEGERQMLRVWTSESAMFDLECVHGQWFVYKVWD